AGDAPADRVTGPPEAADQEAVAQVAEGARAIAGQPDVVAGDRVVVHVEAECHAIAVVAADDVAGSSGRAADGVAGRVGADRDAVPQIPQGPGSGPVGAEVVAHDHVANRAGAADADTVAGVAADDVAGPGRGTADRVILRRLDRDTAGRVREGRGARRVG